MPDTADRRALVTGVTGQDGHYLVAELVAEGWQVYGLVTAGDRAQLPDGVVPLTGDLRDQASLTSALAESRADVVYNLAAVSSVAASWQDPVLVADVSGLGVARLLTAVRDADRAVRVVHASSAEIFGDAAPPQAESTPIAPTNPYGAAKAFAQHLVQAYRTQGVWVASAILFPHESPRRPEQFVTRKITRAVAAIATGRQETLVLGNLDARRDWGFAGDYARALHLIAQATRPDDWVVASGRTHSIGDFVEAAFVHAGVADWRQRVSSSAEFVRPVDAAEQCGDAGRLRTELGWRPTVGFDELVASMVDHDLELLRETD